MEGTEVTEGMQGREQHFDNPLNSILIMKLVSIVAMCHNNVAAHT